jgi:hypothetical protein
MLLSLMLHLVQHRAGNTSKGKERVTSAAHRLSALLLQQAIRMIHSYRTCSCCSAGASRSVPYMYNNTDNRHLVPLPPCCSLGELGSYYFPFPSLPFPSLALTSPSLGRERRLSIPASTFAFGWQHLVTSQQQDTTYILRILEPSQPAWPL